MCGGDESQRERSVCGQNKMYPVLKESLNYRSGLEQWFGQFHLPKPLTISQAVPHNKHAHTQHAVFSLFQGHRRRKGGAASHLMH